MNRKQDFSVSVIIPFVDNHEDVLQFKSRLDQQTYPKEFTEIIFVDNGSKRNIAFPEEFLHDVIVIREFENLNSPYSARNRGIEIAKGEVLVFVDANSRPDPDWLEKGLMCMKESGSEITAGDVQFYLGDSPPAAHIADALTSIHMEKAVLERGVAYTANLFIRKETMESVGFFEERTRSGGDVRWCMRANEKGFRISFCKESVVYKFPRSLKNLLIKKIRTGKGYFYTWKDETDKPIWFYNFFRSLKPPSLSKWNHDKMRKKAIDSGNRTKVRLILYMIGIVEQISFISEYLRYNLGSQRDIDRREEGCK